MIKNFTNQLIVYFFVVYFSSKKFLFYNFKLLARISDSSKITSNTNDFLFWEQVCKKRSFFDARGIMQCCFPTDWSCFQVESISILK